MAKFTRNIAFLFMMAYCFIPAKSKSDFVWLSEWSLRAGIGFALTSIASSLLIQKEPA